MYDENAFFCNIQELRTGSALGLHLPEDPDCQKPSNKNIV